MSVTAYIKPTNFCNVGCDHCYLPDSVRKSKDRMDETTVMATAQTLNNMANGRSVDIVYHGGEPLTQSVDWFYKAGNAWDLTLPDHSEVIQSSLIPYTRDYAELIKSRMDGVIGSSIDFAQRKIKGSVSHYHELWLNKVSLARSDGIVVVPGMVPTIYDVGRESVIIDWMIDHDFAVFNIDRYNQFEGHNVERPDNRQHSDFLIGMFTGLMEKIQNNDRVPFVPVIEAAIKGVLYGVPGERWGTTCQSDFIVVEPDGKLNNCPDKTSHEPAYSNVFKPYEDFESSYMRRKWVRIQSVTHNGSHCETCDYNSWCKSGCPITSNNPAEDNDCSGYSRFLRHIDQWLLNEDNLAAAKHYISTKGA